MSTSATTRDLPLQETLALYADSGRRTEGHLRLRWRSCPLDAVAARVPARGRILDYGCGHGLLSTYLALGSRERDILGVDVDEEKLALASRAAARATERGARIRFAAIAPGEIPPGPWDAIAIVDILYLIEPKEQRRILLALAGGLRPGGTLLVKEVARRPRWKYWWCYLQEVLAVRVLRITRGTHLHFAAPETLATWLGGAGLALEHHPLHRGYPHPHHLLVARAPELPPGGRDRSR